MAWPKPGYQLRPDNIANDAWETGYLTAWQVERIVAWKSAIAVAGITLNKEHDVQAQTRDAIDALVAWRDCRSLATLTPTDWEQWRDDVRVAIGRQGKSGLLKLRGVGYPVATAILDLLNPNAWPVI